MNRKVFAERLESLRKERGLLGKELAAQVGVPYGTYSTWESGHRIPRTDMFLKIAKILDVNAHYLAGESDTRSPIKKLSNGPIAAHDEGPMGREIDIDDILEEEFPKFLEWRRQNKKE